MYWPQLGWRIASVMYSTVAGRSLITTCDRPLRAIVRRMRMIQRWNLNRHQSSATVPLANEGWRFGSPRHATTPRTSNELPVEMVFQSVNFLIP